MFVELTVDDSLLRSRLTSRAGHFMPAALLESQLATLEPLGADEPGIRVDTGASPDRVVETIIRELAGRGAERLARRRSTDGAGRA
ncbi:hypothetical protein GCM10025870_07280 [Agromyces marinus]|uniref:gluconokinase n=1 Tax=Agromyces marinus TaxID=1389020 RepID=A0ABM8GYW6_9MICO|nr:hypothetical protein GCM10025870_07280 [Agromyces marinus]